MNKTLLLVISAVFLFPATSSAAALTNDQASSLISVVQSSPGTAASAFVSLITTFSNITVAQAESLIGVVQQSPGTPASAFVDLLVSFTVDPVVVQQPVQQSIVTPPAPVVGSIAPTPQPIVPPTPIPVPAPTPVAIAPQGVTEQVGYNIEYEQRVIRDVTTEADGKCTGGKIDPTCAYLYAEVVAFQNLLNLVQSQYSTHRTQACDDNLSSVYGNLEQVIVGYYLQLTNLTQSPHTAAYSQGMQDKYLSDYQDGINKYLPQAQSISSTCFGV